MVIEHFPEIQNLTASEKLIFLSELWDELAAHPSEVPVERGVIEELDRRMEEFRQHPDRYTTWESVRDKILSGKK